MDHHRGNHIAPDLDEAVHLLEDLLAHAPRDTDNWLAYADSLDDSLIRRFDVLADRRTSTAPMRPRSRPTPSGPMM